MCVFPDVYYYVLIHVYIAGNKVDNTSIAISYIIPDMGTSLVQNMV